MPNGIHLHQFCKCCGSTFLDVTTLFNNGVICCKECGEKGQFTLNKTNINPAPGNAVKMIGNHNVTMSLDGYLSELNLQEMQNFPSEGCTPVTTLVMMLRGLIRKNTIYANDSLKPIYALLSQANSFRMLVKMYQELVSSTKSPEEIIAELRIRGLEIGPSGVFSLEKPLDPDDELLIAMLEESLEKERV